MKQVFKSLLIVIGLLSITSVYGQWTTSGSNVGLTTTTNNVIVGPTPATPTNLYVNNTASTTSIVSIDNYSVNPSGPSWRTSQLNFNAAGVNKYKIFYASTPSQCGSDLFHIMSATNNTPGIHFSGSGITFSNDPQATYCGNVFAFGKYAFDGTIGSTGLNVGYWNTITPPSGYKLTNLGASYFNDKVVIGTSNTTLPTSTHKLYVGGSIICEELVVKLQANWPDFVFSSNYKLKPLSEVKSYIAENSHLPGVPAACEIEAYGVATGEMLTIQMKKIEELTLYLIQMEERIKELEAQNKTLDNLGTAK